MKMMKQTLLIGSSFASGVIAGYLLSGRSSSATVERVRVSAGGTFHKTGDWLRQKNRNLQILSEKIKKELSHPIPDLYLATESLALSEEDLL